MFPWQFSRLNFSRFRLILKLTGETITRDGTIKAIPPSIGVETPIDIPKPAYYVRRGDPWRERETILNLWSISFTSAEQFPEKYDLFHLRNPAGPSQMYFLDHTDSGTSVGIVCIAPRRWKAGREYVNAGIIADMVVSPEHRSLGPAVKLHNESLALALKNSDFVYGFPNLHSVTLARFAKFQLIDHIYRYAKPLRFSSYLRNRLPAWLAFPAASIIGGCSAVLTFIRALPSFFKWRTENISGLDTRFDELWESAALEGFIIGQRDSGFLNWRFLRNKTRNYRLFGLVNKKTGELDGYIVYDVDKNGFVSIADFLARDTRKTLRPLLLLFEREMRRHHRKAVSINFHGARSITKTLGILGYNRRESNPLCCKWTDRFAKLKDDREWYFTSADNDV